MTEVDQNGYQYWDHRVWQWTFGLHTMRSSCWV